MTDSFSAGAGAVGSKVAARACDRDQAKRHCAEHREERPANPEGRARGWGPAILMRRCSGLQGIVNVAMPELRWLVRIDRLPIYW
jgi:hypothetical protein